MKKLTQKEQQKILKLRAQFPRKINVSIESVEGGGFFAQINDLPGCFTEASTFSELIEMVNDCVRTYFEIPVSYLSFMPTYLPSLSAASAYDFPAVSNEFPAKTDFKIANNSDEKVSV